MPIDLGALIRQHGGTVHPARHVGERVRLRDGDPARIVAVHPDGRLSVQRLHAHKVSQASVQYTPHATMPRERCDRCRFFLAPAACKKVASPISPAGWCDVFLPEAKQVKK